jgi:hypothetical protein
MKIWILIALLTVSFGVACGLKNSQNSPGTTGSGVIKTDSRNIVGFKKIRAESAIDLSVSVTNGFSVVVKADDNIISDVITKLDGDTLVISLKDKTNSKSKISISVTMPAIDGLDLTGATTATVSGVKADELTVSATGAAKAKIEGVAKTLKIKAVGASEVDAEGLTANKAEVDAVGASKIMVSATDELTASATGASGVTYVGEPKSLKQNASDVSTISKK